MSRRKVKRSYSGVSRKAQTDLPVERLIRIERRKSRNRAVSLSIFVMAIMLVTILLIIAVMKQVSPNPSLMFIQEGTVVHNIQGTGLVIRDEQTFEAPASGLIRTLVAEGSRVSKDQKLAMIVPENMESQLAELQKCENDLISLQINLMNAGKGAGAQAIFDESAAALANLVSLVRLDVSKGDLSNMSGYATSISVILEQRTTNLLAIDFNDSRLDELEARKASLESALGLEAGSIYAPKPGIVSYRYDGLESSLDLDMAWDLSVSDIQEYMNQSDPQNNDQTTVKDGQTILKVSSGLVQNLAFVLDSTDPEAFPVGSIHEIKIPNDDLVIGSCEVVRSEAFGSKTLIVFETDRKVERLMNRRTVVAELTLSQTTGLKVPVSALIDYDETDATASLMMVVKGRTRTCKVNVIDQGREFAIVEGIETEPYQPALSSVLVSNPQSIEEGELIGN